MGAVRDDRSVISVSRFMMFEKFSDIEEETIMNQEDAWKAHLLMAN